MHIEKWSCDRYDHFLTEGNLADIIAAEQKQKGTERIRWIPIWICCRTA